MKTPVRLLWALLPLLTMCSDGTDRVSLPKNTLPFDSLFIARQDGKWGWIDRNGNVAIPFAFDSVTWYGNNTAVRYVFVNKKAGCIDYTGAFIVQPRYDELVAQSGDSIFSAKLNGNAGLITRDGTVLVPFKYEYIYNADARGDSVYVAKRNDKVGLVTQHGKEITPMIFTSIDFGWTCGVTTYRIGFKWGYVSDQGKVSAPVYETENDAKSKLSSCPADTVTGEFCNGLSLVTIAKTELSGYKDKKGEWVVRPMYKHAQSFSEGLAAVTKDGENWFYIDTTGAKLFGDYKDASPFVEGLAVVDSKKVIDHEGKIVAVSAFPIRDYDEDDNLFRVDARNDDYVDGECGLMDRSGDLIVDPNFYHEFGIVSDGMIAVCEKDDPYEEINGAHDHIWGFIDTTGHEVIPCQYNMFDFDSHFCNGLAPVPRNGKYGYLDKTGKTAIPFIYDSANNFYNGLAQVWLNHKMKYIDPAGKVVWEEK